MENNATVTRKRDHHLAGLTLIELLSVIAIIATLAALSIPAITKVRERAIIAKSANNLKQIYYAFQMYVIDHDDMCFWRGENVGTDGMDWFVHGGQSSGNLNTGQEGLFNKYNPRPLNQYVGNNLEIFHHPSDRNATHYNMVGNNYAFNSVGHPSLMNAGLSGEPFSAISNPSRTIAFIDAHLMIPGLSWAGQNKGNICFADGHIAFMELPGANDESISWGIFK